MGVGECEDNEECNLFLGCGVSIVFKGASDYEIGKGKWE